MAKHKEETSKPAPERKWTATKPVDHGRGQKSVIVTTDELPAWHDPDK